MNQELMNIHEQAMEKLKPVFREMEDISLKNTQKVLEAFRRHQLSFFHFAASNGYGYDDAGREKLEEIWADDISGGSSPGKTAVCVRNSCSGNRTSGFAPPGRYLGSRRRHSL